MQSYKKKNYTPRFDGARIWQGFGKGLGEKNSGGRESNTRAPYLVRQSCRTRRKSNRRSFFAAKVRELSKLFSGKRELHGEKDYTPRLDGARIWQKIRAVERAARVRRTWYGSRAEREESQTTVPFPLQKCVNCQSCLRERESCTERKITPRGLTAPGFFQPKKVKAPFACLKTPLRSELI